MFVGMYFDTKLIIKQASLKIILWGASHSTRRITMGTHWFPWRRIEMKHRVWFGSILQHQTKLWAQVQLKEKLLSALNQEWCCLPYFQKDYCCSNTWKWPEFNIQISLLHRLLPLQLKQEWERPEWSEVDGSLRQVVLTLLSSLH